MIDTGKRNVLGVLVDGLDYDAATHRILQAAEAREGSGVTALAVHGVMTGFMDAEHRYRLNQLDLVTPDGQPVRWALNVLYGIRLSDRVYGPKLMTLVCAQAAARNLPVFLYGSQDPVLDALANNLRDRFPRLVVAGTESSKFRRTSETEQRQLANRIISSGARITFVGLGCPRQEVFASECRERLGMPVVAVGAAFDYHAGIATEPPSWVQRVGMQWAYRLAQSPRRLWRRYLLLNPAYAVLLLVQASGAWKPDEHGIEPSGPSRYG